jgi:DNA-binding response OmpR family regulator
MRKILVVNNDMDTMSLLQSWLERKSYKVKYTGNGDEVPQLVQEFRPNLILVDILQKDVAEQIKSSNKIANVPVILMTGYTLRQTPIEVPVDDVIEKPFNLRVLEQKIEKLIS